MLYTLVADRDAVTPRDTGQDGTTPAYLYAPVLTATGANTYLCLCYFLCGSALGTYAFDALGGFAFLA